MLAANVFSYETGLQLVKKRGELMSKAEEGAMAAVIGMQKDRIKEIILEHYLENVYIANHNSPVQTVLAGKKDDLNKAENLMMSLEDPPHFINLKVSGAFHSPLMEPAKKKFQEFIEGMEFKEPDTTVIANVNAKPYSPENIKNNLIEQLTSPVQWVNSIE